MRAWFVFLVALKQKRRDHLGLLLTVLTAPLFVMMYWVFFSDVSATYHVAIFDGDTTAQAGSTHGAAFVESLEEFTSSDGTPFFSVSTVSSRSALERTVQRGEASVGVVLNDDFSRGLSSARTAAKAELIGDATDPNYRISSALIGKALNGYAAKVTATPPTVTVEENPIGLSGARTPFEAYVPGLLVFAVIMLIFSSSMSVVREVESGTLARLRLTPVTSLDLLFGLSSVQLILGLASVSLTLATAWLLGFRSEGSLILAMAIASLACLASVGIGMVVASLSKTQTRSFLISSVAMFLLVLFSGIVFPRPDVTILTVAGQTIDLFDLLPTTHMGGALGKVMTLGATTGEIAYEIIALTAISLANYVLGGLLFARSGRPASDVWEGLP